MAVAAQHRSRSTGTASRWRRSGATRSTSIPPGFRSARWSAWTLSCSPPCSRSTSSRRNTARPHRAQRSGSSRDSRISPTTARAMPRACARGSASRFSPTGPASAQAPSPTRRRRLGPAISGSRPTTSPQTVGSAHRSRSRARAGTARAAATWKVGARIVAIACSASSRHSAATAWDGASPRRSAPVGSVTTPWSRGAMSPVPVSKSARRGATRG